MGKFSTVNRHHRTPAMCYYSSNMGVQGVCTSHVLGFRNNVWNVGFVLVHSIDYHTEILTCTRTFLCLVMVLGILFTLFPNNDDIPL